MLAPAFGLPIPQGVSLGILGVAQLRHPTVDTTVGGYGVAMQDIDATNLSVTFRYPPSGRVLCTVSSCKAPTGSNGSIYFGIREGTTNLVQGRVSAIVNLTYESASFVLTGVPGSKHTYKASVGRSGANTVTMYHGPTFGAQVLTVEALSSDLEQSAAYGLPMLSQSNGLLGVAQLSHPTVDTTMGGVSTMADVAGMSPVTFRFPQSGKVLVSMGSAQAPASAGTQYFGVREGTTNIGQAIVSQSTVLSRHQVWFVFTGVPGSVHTYKAAVGKGGAGSTVLYHGPAYGAIVLSVWALPSALPAGPAVFSIPQPKRKAGWVKVRHIQAAADTNAGTFTAIGDLSGIEPISFRFPSSGKVLVSMQAYTEGGGTQYWAVRESTVTVKEAMHSQSSGFAKFNSFMIEGKPGSFHTYKMAGRSSSTVTFYHGPNHGAITFKIEDVP